MGRDAKHYLFSLIILTYTNSIICLSVSLLYKNKNNYLLHLQLNYVNVEKVKMEIIFKIKIILLSRQSRIK